MKYQQNWANVNKVLIKKMMFYLIFKPSQAAGNSSSLVPD